ncbi:MAG TPA: hypothetical protein P5110_02610 [Candidatus Omnitrophota bacterium]|nr:hypothetical protein [Candidatus Omnitrophota bacterium]HRZ14379.1 hypothetical protein [Candidatus Omnitrophota bacterium]
MKKFLMRIFTWQVKLGIVLVAFSALGYYIHYRIFHDLHHIVLYLVGDIAFVFVEVLMVTLILHELLAYREKQHLLKKLNMVVGAFYSEVGGELLKQLSAFDPGCGDLARKLVVRKDWTTAEFLKLRAEVRRYACSIDAKRSSLEELKCFLLDKRVFLVRLLENPSLLENESFTTLLWAVFHLTEELGHRKQLKQLPEPDYQHLANDIKRAYLQLISDWLGYLSHLQTDYPYLFSLALRTNPFDPAASVEIK